MALLRWALLPLAFSGALFAATFGTVVPLVGGASDIVLDEARSRLYLVNNSQNRVEIYSIPQRRLLNPVRTDTNPVAAAISRSGKFLYVTSYDGSALDVMDLDALAIVKKVSLPARPEGVAVGVDERVLISTIGTGAGNAFNVLLIYDPNATDSNAVTSVALTPAPPGNPPIQSAPPAGRPYLVSRSYLQASNDGSMIIGVNLPTTTTRSVFVYEAKSGTVLRSRTVNNISSVISVAADNSKFMSGLTLFDTNTLEVIAQQNAANSPYPLPTGVNFNTQTNQGGSVFAPDGSVMYSAFDVTPVQVPAARPNISQLMLSDPDHLLIQMGLQLPENLSGKLVISADGANIYGISESGFTIIPISTMNQNPIAVPDATVSLLANDQCGVTAALNSSSVNVRNAGKGRMTVNASVLQQAATGPGGLGGANGPGGGIPGGGGIVIILPGGGVAPVGGTTQTPAVATIAPSFRTRTTADGAALDLTYTSVAAAKTPGTVSPSSTFLIQSNEAINIPAAVRVFQNYRTPEATADLILAQVGTSATDALEDIVLDSARQKAYIANSGLNRIEVFDTRTKQFQAPIKAGQLPRSLALAPDGNTLYVANTGGESIGVIDLNQGRMVDRIHFPALPFNANVTLVTPSIIVATERGPMIMMSNGALWRVVGNQAVPRPTSGTIGSATVTAPRSMAATPNGEYAIVLAGNGFVYLYDALADDFVQGRQIFSNPIQGYYGPVTAGPRGNYYVVNGTVLNQALTPISAAGSVQIPGNGGTTTTLARPISAVAAVGASNYVRFAQPVRVNATTAATTASTVELVDTNSGATLRTGDALEGPVSIQTGTARVNVNGRTVAVDPSGSPAYLLTTSGLSIVELAAPGGGGIGPGGGGAANTRPSVNLGGVVNLASYLPTIAQGSIFSIYGRNLGDAQAAGSVPMPTILGGTCVTLNNIPVPLFATSTGQINAQVPVELAAGRYPLVVHSIANKVASPSQTVTISKYAPGIFVDSASGLAAIYDDQGRVVSKDNKTTRDRALTMYAVGLGLTKGGKVSTGAPAPSSPLAVSDPVKVYFGNPAIKEAEIIVEWSGLMPGLVGVFQINLRVPGTHIKGDALPVTLKIGTVSSQTTGPAVPTIAVE